MGIDDHITTLINCNSKSSTKPESIFTTAFSLTQETLDEQLAMLPTPYFASASTQYESSGDQRYNELRSSILKWAGESGNKETMLRHVPRSELSPTCRSSSTIGESQSTTLETDKYEEECTVNRGSTMSQALSSSQFSWKVMQLSGTDIRSDSTKMPEYSTHSFSECDNVLVEATQYTVMNDEKNTNSWISPKALPSTPAATISQATEDLHSILVLPTQTSSMNSAKAQVPLMSPTNLFPTQDQELVQASPKNLFQDFDHEVFFSRESLSNIAMQKQEKKVQISAPIFLKRRALFSPADPIATKKKEKGLNEGFEYRISEKPGRLPPKAAHTTNIKVPVTETTTEKTQLGMTNEKDVVTGQQIEKIKKALGAKKICKSPSMEILDTPDRTLLCQDSRIQRNNLHVHNVASVWAEGSVVFAKWKSLYYATAVIIRKASSTRAIYLLRFCHRALKSDPVSCACGDILPLSSLNSKDELLMVLQRKRCLFQVVKFVSVVEDKVIVLLNGEKISLDLKNAAISKTMLTRYKKRINLSKELLSSIPNVGPDKLVVRVALTGINDISVLTNISNLQISHEPLEKFRSDYLLVPTTLTRTAKVFLAIILNIPRILLRDFVVGNLKCVRFADECLGGDHSNLLNECHVLLRGKKKFQEEWTPIVMRLGAVSCCCLSIGKGKEKEVENKNENEIIISEKTIHATAKCKPLSWLINLIVTCTKFVP